MKALQACVILFISTISLNCFADVSVIVHPSNNSAMTEDDISRMFLGKNKSFSNGSSVTPVNAKYGSGTRAEFEDKIIGKSKSQIKAYWSKLIFTGKGKPPTELSSDEDIIAFVASNPGAIGYVAIDKVNDTVKVVK